MGIVAGKTPKEGVRPSGGARKSRMVLAAFVAESPAHRRKLQGFCDYAAKAGWIVETVVDIGALGQSIMSPDESPFGLSVSDTETGSFRISSFDIDRHGAATTTSNCHESLDSRKNGKSSPFSSYSSSRFFAPNRTSVSSYHSRVFAARSSIAANTRFLGESTLRLHIASCVNT